MTTSHAASSAAPAEKQASKYVLQDWEPNNPEKWDSKLAWRTLTITTYSLILGFCVWFLPSAIAPKLTLLGFNLSASQLYWLTALPGLAAGHVMGLVIPQSWTEAMGVSEHAYHMVAIIGGGIAGLMTLVGLFGLLYRRIVKKSVRLATSRNDVFMYLLLTCAILLGAAATLTTQILGKPGGYNYRETIAVWFRSIFTLQPDVSLMTDVPLQFKLHIIAAFILFAAWPFTRLVHVVSAPVAYPTRPYVVYRSRRAATSTSRPARGWTPVRGGAAGPKAQSFPEDDAPYQGA